MGSIINLKIGERDIRLFAGEFSTNSYFCGAPLIIHRHRYTEIHIILQGEALYTIGGTEYRICSGEGIVIPAKMYHTVEAVNCEKMIFTAFQADIKCEKPNFDRLNEMVFESFMQTMDTNKNTLQPEKTAMYALWFINELCFDMPASVSKNTDYAYFIFEYLSSHYNEDITVSDIAQELNFSTKQVQRIIKRETGRTFLSELTAHRMRIAEYLIETDNMSLKEIAEHVGYNSYSGFWKAWQKYRREKENKT